MKPQQMEVLNMKRKKSEEEIEIFSKNKKPQG
jgi:hypothetical protein